MIKIILKNLTYPLIFLLVGVSIVIVVPNGTYTSTNMQSALITTDGKPTPALLGLLNIFDIQHDGTLKSIVDATQKSWLRPKDKERWQVEDILKGTAARVVPIIATLGCLDEIAPQEKEYTYALILGATAPAMRNRLAYLIEQWCRGVKFGKLVFLLSERPTDPVRENKEVLLHSTTLPIKKEWQFDGALPKNEYEVMRFIYDQAELPKAFKEIPVVWINYADSKLPGDDIRKRSIANTGDTVHAWLSKKPMPGSCLVVSSQPYVGYQDSVMRTLLPQEFTLETVGPPASGNDKITSYIDNIARWLYQEHKRRSKL